MIYFNENGREVCEYAPGSDALARSGEALTCEGSRRTPAPVGVQARATALRLNSHRRAIGAGSIAVQLQSFTR